MVADFSGYNDAGHHVKDVWCIHRGRLLSMFEKYHTGPDIWQGHSSRILLHNIKKAIHAVVEDGAISEEMPYDKRYYFWGLRNEEEPMDERDCLNMFYTWLRFWQTIVEEYPNLRWYCNEWYVESTLYREDDEESAGEDLPEYDEYRFH
jgi:hypothetical protein